MLAVCVFQIYMATQVLRTKCMKGVQRTAASVSNMCSGFTNRDIFIILVCFTVILLGVAHLVLTNDVMPRRRYRDAELEEARMYANNMSRDDWSKADALYRQVRVFCMVMATRESLWTRGVHVNSTWGRRCNKIVFMSDVSDPEFPYNVVGVYTSKGRNFLTQKVFESFDYVYDHHHNDADWFLKCDDDTYIIMENLRFFLSDKDPNEAVFFGQHFRNTKRINYFTGGAGYVVSRNALKKFRYRDPNLCKGTWEGTNEDVRTSECMSHLGVRMGNTRDDIARTRFHAFPPMTHMLGEFPNWYKYRSVWGVQKGADSMSSYAISFHKFESSKYIYLLEYFIYHLRPYGVQFDHVPDIDADT